MNDTVDARGLSCPQPVLDTLNFIQSTSANQVKVMVDTEASKENVTRAAQSKGWEVTSIEELDEEYHIMLAKA